ncbi:phenylalanine--tRNA ligase subunit beta [Rhodothalassium salexigens]|uniref:phenylalanine--tRNA ligase subunit beta n=1 Tax=Rhodothalassium salexigens TaxID=1086 RepID=UPI001911446A|nr:phenylalanine--tRNA ligase subunit beta [Rhodothalassium salexigens]MBK5911345.1 phenylalanine--tRNA ligase subunit beta [Rhodothalassium salexigens]
MKFTLSWLKQHLDTAASRDAIAEALTACGLELEAIEDPAATLGAFVIGHVVACEQHPNADKLRVTRVDFGAGEPVQVICGAPNARLGMKGVFAPSGTYVPGTDMTLKPTKIRGLESRGMLCSERELLLSDAHDGIIDLPEDAPVGTRFVDYAGLDDPVFDIAITPNRQECLGVRGIARDLAAAGLGTLKAEAPVALADESGAAAPKVTLAFPEGRAPGCAHFLLRRISGVANGAGPDGLVRRLKAVGAKPISALVDVTNFMTLDRARPLHVFDAAKVRGDLVVRPAEPGETLDALDDATYTLHGGEVVIADDTGVISLAGVIGGKSTGVDETTTDVLVEAAWFDPVRTAETGRAHDIMTDARYRFERGVDPASTAPELDRACQMIVDLCGGTPGPVSAAGQAPDAPAPVRFRPERVASLGGVDVAPDTARRILADLGFSVDDSAGVPWTVAVPSWRPDVDGEADLVEDVLRIHGYDHIPSTPLPRTADWVARPTLTLAQKRTRRVRRRLAAEGLSEAITWSFVDRALAEAFGGAPAELAVTNPISSDLDQMRPSILPHLCDAARRNIDRGQDCVGLFEVGPQYRDARPEGQQLVAAGVRAGRTGARHWRDRPRDVDLFDAKADALAALAEAGAKVDAVQTLASAPDWYHPGRSGSLCLGPKTVLAVFGEVHPTLVKRFDIKAPVVAFEVYLDAIPAPKAKKAKKGAATGGATKPALQLSNLPSVERDFAFVVAADVPAQDLVRAAAGAERQTITDVRLFDVYQGEGLDPGEKSVALSVVFEPRARTFTDDEIAALSERVVAAVAKATGGRLRG